MADEMIQRGAEAMRVKRRELINQPLERIWPDLMRAAIQAMWEPTIEMARAGARGDIDAEDATYIWQDMIEAARRSAVK